MRSKNAPRPTPRSFSPLTKLLIFLIPMLAFAGYYQYMQVKGATARTAPSTTADVGNIRTLDDSGSTLGEHTSITIGADGYPVISYQDSTNYALKLYTCDDAACSTGTARTLEDVANWVGFFTAIAIGSDGFPVISYYDQSTTALKLYTCDNAACSSGTARMLEDTTSNVGSYTDIAIGSDDYPVVSYLDMTILGLKLYKCDNAACSTGTVRTLDDPGNLVGWYTSIAIGSDGYPVISYQDSTAGALKLYKCDNAACSSGTARTVEDVRNAVGRYTSIAIGNDDYPVISYQDYSTNALKFARVPNREVTLNTTPTTTGSTLGNGLVGHWTFDGPDMTTATATDVSGRSNNGALLAGPRPAAGKAGQGLLFDGTDDYINLGVDGATPDLDLTAEMSISAWMKLNGDYTSPQTIAARYDFSSGRTMYWLDYGNYDNYITFFSGTAIIINTTSPITDNDWHHVVVTRSGSAGAWTITIYVDNVAHSQQTALNPQTDGDENTAIGKSPDGSSGHFDGILDDVRIYNRVLTADEIAELYEQAAGSEVGICGEGGVRDADGNVYGIVQIGTQCWLDRNMNVGTRINVSSNQTNNATIEKHCYNDTASNCTDPHPKHPDGGLYQWNEAMQYSTTEGAQGICPTGWHVPTDAEWHTLEEYLKEWRPE